MEPAKQEEGEEVATESDDFTTVSRELEYFAEAEAVITYLHALKGDDDGDITETPAQLTAKIEAVLDQYQEQPHLLDGHLEAMVTLCLDVVKLHVHNQEKEQEVEAAFSLLYMLTKVRGYKTVLKRFSHQSTDFIFVLELVEAEVSRKDVSLANTEVTAPTLHIEGLRWKRRYVLLLWLSLIALMPFNIAVFDEESTTGAGIVRRIFSLCKVYLAASDKASDGAAQVAARFFSRPDIANTPHAHAFIDWALASIQDNKSGHPPVVVGALASLAALFKIAKRAHMLSAAPRVITTVQECDLMSHGNTLVRKLATKLVQRVGLLFLPPRVASWRYNRGARSLAHNLQSARSTTNSEQGETRTSTGKGSEESDASHTRVANGANDDEDEDEEYDIPDELEDLIDVLLTALGDKDTIVRWSGAKGVGRITGRLPRDLADEVVESLLEKLTAYETDSAWHGACLSLAELARRGLLLPERLPLVMPLVYQALAYDVLQGSCSVGSHVRDAACFVCWAFARAYHPAVLKAYVMDISANLVVTALFDRENNVRRAASAAFQEIVGRLGTVPHGIDIITKADYFAVGNRKHAYLDVALFVAQFEEYRAPIVQHLAEVKLVHWDGVVRRLAAASLELISKEAPLETLAALKQFILPHARSKDLNTRQGCIRGIGSIVHGLVSNHSVVLSRLSASSSTLSSSSSAVDTPLVSLYDHTRFLRHVLGADVVADIHDLFDAVAAKGALKGLGGAMVRKAVLSALFLLTKAKFPLMPPHDVATATPQASVDRSTEEGDAPHQGTPSSCAAMTGGGDGDGVSQPHKRYLHWLDFLSNSLEDPDDEVRASAVQGLNSFLQAYTTVPAPPADTSQQPLVARECERGEETDAVRNGQRSAVADGDDTSRAEAFLATCRSHLYRVVLPGLMAGVQSTKAQAQHARSATATLLGQLSSDIIGPTLPDVLETLCMGAQLRNGEANQMVALRSASLEAITVLSSDMLLVSSDDLVPRQQRAHLSLKVINELVQGLDDYTVTSRGDVGSLVRLAAIRGVRTFVVALLRSALLENAEAERLILGCIRGLIKQVMEKLDRVRSEAGNALSVVVAEVHSAHMPLADAATSEAVSFLHNTIFSSISEHFDWSATHQTFPLLIQCLSVDPLRKPVLHGLTSSVGGLTESLVRSSSAAVISYIFSMSDEMKAAVMLDLVAILEEFAADDLVVIPTLKTCDLIISAGAVDSLVAASADTFAVALALQAKGQMKKCTNVSKIVHCVHVLCSLLNFPCSFRDAMLSLSLALCHKYPRVRRATSEAVYVAFLGLDIPAVEQAQKQKVIAILLETAWDGDVKVSRSQRNMMCDILALPKPKTKAGTGKKPKAATNELDSYKDLVDRAGY